ncbi:MAG: peptidylprolyl isomerase [Bacteroidales bacterium]|jgi:peptidyl-prolyl cis-trans isomerase SurA|nr:peptidylprolyl isomerase [Bacteroidales bacterium]
MKIGSRLLLGLALLLLSGITQVKSQQVLVESVAAIVGNEVIYLSDIENMAADARRSGNKMSMDDLRCEILQQLLVAKLFLDQARIDSIIVTDSDIEGELNVRLNDAIRSAGSEEALKGYFKKSMTEIQQDIRKVLLEQATIREVQRNVAQGIKVTPSELKKFFTAIPKDSLPVIPQKVELSLIQLDPPQNEENKAEARQKLLDIRGRILEGQSFAVQAIMYSEDPGSASRGGELGYLMRGELEKPFADAAFSLTKNTVSKIVETRHGFHIIQLIDRNGDLINTRHILIKSRVRPDQAALAMSKLDSIADLVRKDSIKFADAALRFSTHKDSRINGGKFVSTDPSERDTWFALEELNPEMYIKVRDLKVGEISDPFRTTDENNNVVFRIVKLDSEIPAHRANLKDDYQNLYNAALMNKQTKTYDEWIQKKLSTTYVKISDEFKSCEFLKKGWLK